MGTPFLLLAHARDKKELFRGKQAILLSYFLLDLPPGIPAQIAGWAVIPNHLHLLFSLTQEDFRGEQFFHYLERALKEELALPLEPQPKIIPIASYANFVSALSAIHFDPVFHGLVQHAIDYPFSTYHEHLKLYGDKEGAYGTPRGDFSSMIHGV